MVTTTNSGGCFVFWGAWSCCNSSGLLRLESGDW